MPLPRCGQSIALNISPPSIGLGGDMIALTLGAHQNAYVFIFR
jgi:hypothetical protein